MARGTVRIDPAKLETFGQVSSLLRKYRPGRVGMVHRLPDGTWAVNQSGFVVEPLGKTLEEIDAYLQAHAQQGGHEAQMKEFTEKLLAVTGLDLSGEQPVRCPVLGKPRAPGAAPPAPGPRKLVDWGE